MFTQQTIRNTAINLPSLGFGGAAIGGLLTDVDNNDAQKALNEAIKQGFRFFDTAPFYGFGKSERLVGDAIRDVNYTLSTKVGRLLHPRKHPNPASLGWSKPLPFSPIFDYSYDGIMRSYEDSLQRLGLDRIDILLVHDIGEMTHGDDHQQYWKQLTSTGYKALDELKQQQQIQAIGLGVNETKVCEDALDFADFDVILLAGRYTLLEQYSAQNLLKRCQEKDISIILGGPFNSGILAGQDSFNYAKAPQDIIDKVNQIKNICSRHNVSLPAAALQFPLFHPCVKSVIPGTRNIKEFQEVIAWSKELIPHDFWHELHQKNLITENIDNYVDYQSINSPFYV